MSKAKIQEFIISSEYDSIIESLMSIINIDWKSENIPKLINFFDKILWREISSQKEAEEKSKEILDFLTDEKRKEIIDFIFQNYFSKLEDLWSEEKKEVSEQEMFQSDSFEDRERRYIEIMKEMLKLAPEDIKDRIIEKTKEEIVEQSEILDKKPEKIEIKEQEQRKTFDWLNQEQKLPEGTIIIRKKEDNIQEKKDENFLDLSKL